MKARVKVRGMSDRTEQGSILIVVLWSLFFLAALALVINISITPQLDLAMRLRDRGMLYYFAKAGIKRAIIEIKADETGKYDTLNESWSHDEEAFKEIELTDEGYFNLEHLLDGKEDAEEEKRYGLVDEEGRININTAPVDVLRNLFEIIGEASFQEATDIADSIVDWRDEDEEPSDNGAESPYYQDLDSAYFCKNAAFEVLEELLLVREMTQTIFDKVKDYITIYGEGAVNINTADVLVLQSLGMSDTLAEKILLFREGDDGREATEDDNFFDNTQTVTTVLSGKRSLSPEETGQLDGIVGDGLIGVRSDHFRGHSLGGFLDRDVFMEIVFVINRDEEILYWREN